MARLMVLNMFCLLPLLMVSGVVIHENGRCTTYGISSTAEQHPNKVNNILAQPIAFNAERFGEFCSSLASETKVCCDADQFGQLVNQIQQAAVMLNRCPACYHNFREFFCQYTCSPNQSIFKEVKKSVKNDANETCVDTVNYYVSKEFGKKFFDACKDVEMGSTGQKVMDFVFHARNFGEFAAFMGRSERDGGKSPEQINFPTQVPPLGMTPLSDLKVLKACNDSDKRMRCSCSDCTVTCSSEEALLQLDAASQQSVGRDIFFYSMSIPCLVFVLYIVVSLAITSLVNYRSSSTEAAAAAAEPLLHEAPAAMAENESDARSAAMEVDEGEYEAEAFHANLGCVSGAFYRGGCIVGSHPLGVISLCVVVVAIIGALGIPQLVILKDPVKLWAPQGSQALAEKTRHDNTFGPFYRVEQLIISTKDSSTMFNAESGNSTYSASTVLLQMQTLRERLQSIVVDHDGDKVDFESICFRLAPGMSCQVQSVLSMWKAGPTNTSVGTASDAIEHMQSCVSDVAEEDCRDLDGLPSLPNVVFAGYPADTTQYLNATAVPITFLVQGSTSASTIARAVAWERQFIVEIQSALQEPFWKHYTVSYSSEQSLQVELNSQATGDAVTIAISYLVMLVYVMLALGHLFPLRTGFLRTRAMLAAVGVIVVIFSLIVSLGLCASAGIHFTLIISEVIPFLVLAIGVDNIFIIQNAFDKQSERLPPHERLGRALAHVGVSISLSALSECFAFLLGVLTNMPAVQSFAVYASTAVFADFLLQISMFSAAVVLDCRRIEAGRIDCFPCITVARSPSRGDSEQLLVGESEDVVKGVDLIEHFIEFSVVPLLRNSYLKLLVVLSFCSLASFSLYLFRTRLELGLEQQVALPSSSYLQDYFFDVSHTLRVGPPSYMIVDGGATSAPTQTQIANANMTIAENQDRVCDLVGCDLMSLGFVASIEHLHEHESFFASGASNWVSDYLTFLSPDNKCCRQNMRSGEFCSPTSRNHACRPCISASGLDVFGRRVSDASQRPLPHAFERFLPHFLSSRCSADCAVCATAHLMNMRLEYDNHSSSVPPVVLASKFMAFHSVLKTQDDFISALRSARYVSSRVSELQHIDVYSYSVFYVFFEQYLTIELVAMMSIGLALLSILCLCLVLLRNVRVSILIFGTIVMIIVDVIGLMACWEVNLNAVSVVNLVMAVGISVEFCVHVAVAFVYRAKGCGDERMSDALTTSGSSVFRGIFLTKVLGVSVLYFSETPLFEIYFFRMYALICLLGGAHGLIFLPVLLSLFGPQCCSNAPMQSGCSSSTRPCSQPPLTSSSPNHNSSQSENFNYLRR